MPSDSTKTHLLPNDILATLRELNEHITQPVWLFGGVGVDFLVGRWTRPHGDIDLNTLAEYRPVLTVELHQLGYQTRDTGWLTHWQQPDSGRSLEIVFLERDETGNPILLIPQGDAVGVPGIYPLLPGYLNPNRYAQLEDVRFRVSSPAGEWLARAKGRNVVAGRQREPKLEHDLRWLETLITPDELIRLKKLVLPA